MKEERRCSEKCIFTNSYTCCYDCPDRKGKECEDAEFICDSMVNKIKYNKCFLSEKVINNNFCHWQRNALDGFDSMVEIKTECRNKFIFDGNNGFKICSFCGKKIKDI